MYCIKVAEPLRADRDSYWCLLALGGTIIITTITIITTSFVTILAILTTIIISNSTGHSARPHVVMWSSHESYILCHCNRYIVQTRYSHIYIYIYIHI